MPAKISHYTARTRPEYKQLNVRLPVTVYLDLLNVADALQRARGRHVSTVAAVVECIRLANQDRAPNA